MNKLVIGVWLASVFLGSLALTAGVIYCVAHFVSKFW